MSDSSDCICNVDVTVTKCDVTVKFNYSFNGRHNHHHQSTTRGMLMILAVQSLSYCMALFVTISRFGTVPACDRHTTIAYTVLAHLSSN